MYDLKLYIIYYLLLEYIQAQSKINQISNSDVLEYTYSNIATNCVLNVARTYFEESTAVSFSLSTTLPVEKTSTNTDIVLLRALNRELKWPLLLNNVNNIGEIVSSKLNLASNYIFQVRSTEELIKSLAQLANLHSWNSNGNFLVMLNAIVENVQEIVAQFLQILWRYKIINVIVMVHNVSDPKQLDCYTWYPLSEGFCGNNSKTPTIAGKCLNERIHSDKGLFPLRNQLKTINLNGCPLGVQTYIIEPYVIRDGEIIDENNATLKGIEVLLLNTIALQLNFTAVYRISEKNNVLSYVLNELGRSTQADISIGAIPSDNEIHKRFDFTVTYLDESVTWCVPSSEETPRWKNFIFSFSYQSWLLINFSYILCSMLTWLLSRNDLLETLNYRSLGRLFLWNFSILMGIPVQNQPLRITARYITIAYILFCFIVSVTFQTFLMSALTEPIFEKQISNFDELIETDLSYGILESHTSFYATDPKYIDILGKAKICDDIGLCLHNVSYYKNMAVAVPRLYMNYIGKRFINSKGRHLIYAFGSDIVSYPIEMLMTKNFPLLEPFNQIILHLKETGLLSIWQNEYLSETYSIEVNSPENEAVKDGLSLEETQIAFLALLIGISIATLVFIVEYSWGTKISS